MEHKISVTWTNLTIMYTVKLTLWVSHKNQQYVTGASNSCLHYIWPELFAPKVSA